MDEQNGTSTDQPKVVALFQVTLDDQGQVQQRCEGQWPPALLNWVCDLLKTRLAAEAFQAEARQRARQDALNKRVLGPDGFPLPGL